MNNDLISREALKKAEVLYGRPQGEWIDYYYPYFEIPGIKCSICNKDVEYWERHHEKPNFCPNCGADMRKGDAE